MRDRDLGAVTLSEVVIAVGILAIMALSVIAVFTHLLNSAAKTTDLTAGRVFAQRVLDRAVRSGPPNWGFPGGTGSQEITTQDRHTSTTFVYTVTPALLRSDTGLAGTAREFYFVEVQVTWWGTDPDQARPEIGKLSTSLGQAVSFES